MKRSPHYPQHIRWEQRRHYAQCKQILNINVQAMIKWPNEMHAAMVQRLAKNLGELKAAYGITDEEEKDL